MNIRVLLAILSPTLMYVLPAQKLSKLLRCLKYACQKLPIGTQLRVESIKRVFLSVSCQCSRQQFNKTLASRVDALEESIVGLFRVWSVGRGFEL
jgi:hypothetical protein